MTSTPETLLEEIEAKNRELIAKRTTPLLSFLKNKPLLKKPEKGDEKELDKRDKAKRPDKENLTEERASGQSCTLPRRSDVELKDEKPKRLDDESIRDYRDRDRDYERDQERMMRERELLKRQEEECRRQQQKERYEKEKAFKRKEEEMRREKEAFRDKGKKSENPESICASDKIEKKDEVIKRDCIRNKDRPAMQLYQPGARSRSQLCPPDDKPGDSPVDKKQESGISHRKEGGEE
ncbi:LOW QUALITY PROTEIN: regulator of nonsense transcripts 3B-like isoform X1 [Cricetulus griseus]|nr:LOW QUALITY PROTEIN: regulator of nonsense transcripts 3B-like isoform X1 [Cricetulus griseus]